MFPLILIPGLSRLKKPTQDDLRSQVLEFVKHLDKTLTLASIVWVRVLRTTQVTAYNVETVSTPVATSIKTTFAALVKSDKPPAFLGRVSISFSHSLGTRVRLSLLRAISRRQRDKDPNAVCSVTAFTARPLLRQVIIALLTEFIFCSYCWLMVYFVLGTLCSKDWLRLFAI